jgi:hypothetical protein
MKDEDKHKWAKDKSYKPFSEPMLKEKHTCSVCGCEKTVYQSGRWSHNSYIRNGIVYSDRRINCINWEEENKKTVD